MGGAKAIPIMFRAVMGFAKAQPILRAVALV
jgi:hypothetical protein